MTDDIKTDQRIAAYLDGAMEEEERAAFERELKGDADLAEEVSRLASNDALLRQAMAVRESDAVDQAFLAKMGLADPRGPTMPDAANDNPPFWKRWDVRAGAALAASLALVLTMTFQQVGQSGLADALETTPSGQFATLDDDATVRPLLTFQAGDGRFCREFTFARAGGNSSGIACRGSSEWTLEAWSNESVEIPDGREIVMASGGSSVGLDSAYLRLDAGDPISIDRERQLIDQSWPEE